MLYSNVPPFFHTACGHARRLLDIDFTPWVFYVCPAYHVIYISGWTASNDRPALLHRTYDIPNIVGATVIHIYFSHLKISTLAL